MTDISTNELYEALSRAHHCFPRLNDKFQKFKSNANDTENWGGTNIGISIQERSNCSFWIAFADKKILIRFFSAMTDWQLKGVIAACLVVDGMAEADYPLIKKIEFDSSGRTALLAERGGVISVQNYEYIFMIIGAIILSALNYEY